MHPRCHDFRLSLLGGFLAFAVATATPSAAAPSTSLDDAWMACNAQQLSLADRIANCTRIIESGRAKRAAQAQALTARGFAFALQKDFDRALADFDAAIRNNPELAIAYYYRGSIQLERDPERALADFSKAISLDPKDADYFRARGSLYAKRKEYPRAIADLTVAIGLAGKPTSEYFLRGAAYEDMGQRDKAIADFQAALVLDPDNVVLRRHIVHLGGEIPKAVQLPSGLCSANNITHEQRIAGCTASIESGTLTGWPLKVAYCNRGYALTQLGQHDRVITDSDALIAINPQAGCGYLNRARAWYYKHDVDRAIADYTQAITFDPSLHEAYASRGTAYFDRREYGKAIADYDAAISMKSDIPMYLSDRGNTRSMMGEYRSAIADYNRAIEIDPDYSQAYARRGWAFLYLDELANAEADFDKALKLAPADGYARNGRAEVYRRQNKPVPERRSKGLSVDDLRRMME